MTVVSYLKLDKNSGIGCADERESIGGRTYDFIKKIRRVASTRSFIGMAGDAHYADEIIAAISSRAKTDDVREILGIAKNAYLKCRDEKFEESMLKRYNATWEDFKRPNALEMNIHKTLFEALSDPRSQDVGLMLGGLDKDGNFEIFTISYPGTSRTWTFNRFHTIGSGSDRAHIVIGDAINAMDPNDRDNIPLPKGAKILMQATRSAWKNIGVGGRSQLVYVSGGELKELGVDESNVLNNILYCEEKGTLPSEYVDATFSKILMDGAKAADIIMETAGKISSEKLADLFFRQSLHL
ncbi:MAG: hypothetical protein QXF55_02470 [Candidatus Aenigmatarchaeota archaeon]